MPQGGHLGTQTEEHYNIDVTLEPCTLPKKKKRKGIPELLIETRSQQTWGAAFSRNGKRNLGLGDQGWCQPSMEEPRNGDGAGMDETKKAKNISYHQNDIFLAVYK